MNSLDVFLIIFIAYFTIRGIFRGLIKELIIILAILLGYYLAMSLYQPLSKWLMQAASLPETGAQILAFVLIFIVVNVVLRMVGSILEKLIKLVFLQPLNRLGGALFGLLKSLFFLSVIVFILRLLPFAANFLQKMGAGESLIWPYVLYFSTYVFQMLAALIPQMANPDQLLKFRNISLPDTSLFQLLKKY
ncbi:CvpA family protein [Calditrichota bacterium GD2]